MIVSLRIKTYFVLVACFITTALTRNAFSQNAAPASSKTCLWKVQSKANTVYLLGSIHLLKKENYPLPAAMEKAFEEAQVLVLEANADSLALPSVQQFVFSKGAYAEGKTLQGSIATETYSLAHKYAASLGMNLMMLQNFEPWLVGLALTTAKLQQLGLSPEYGIDRYFFEKAKAARKPVLFFESVAFQISRFDNMPPKTQEAFLQETLKEWDVIEKDLDDMVQAWATGDAEAIAGKLFDGFKAYPEIYAALITERNRAWLARIQEFLLRDQTYLIIVGAGHMVGAEGLITQLQALGYSVQQL